MHANMAHGNLTVVYELDISESPLSLDECCPLDWMTISLFQSYRTAKFSCFHTSHAFPESSWKFLLESKVYD
jgi:hypothetical protein